MFAAVKYLSDFQSIKNNPVGNYPLTAFFVTSPIAFYVKIVGYKLLIIN